MIYLIGGPPRVGKSRISDAIRREQRLSVVATDSLGAVLECVLSPEAEPALFVFDRFNKMPPEKRLKLIGSDPSVLVDCVKKESRVVWKAVETFAAREHDEGHDVLIEGVAVLPEFIGRLAAIPHRAVFIGNQGADIEENIKRSARENAGDWMRRATDEYIAAYAKFVRRMSADIEEETGQHRFAYIEMDQQPFGTVVTKVMLALGIDAG